MSEIKDMPKNKCLFCGRFSRNKFCNEKCKNRYYARQRLIKKARLPGDFLIRRHDIEFMKVTKTLSHKEMNEDDKKNNKA
jgi:hypothetical protein